MLTQEERVKARYCEALGADVLNDLMLQGCQSEGCTHKHGREPLHINSRCHMGAGCDVEYYQGILAFRCQECKAPIIKVKVQEKTDFDQQTFSEKPIIGRA